MKRTAPLRRREDTDVPDFGTFEGLTIEEIYEHLRMPCSIGSKSFVRNAVDAMVQHIGGIDGSYVVKTVRIDRNRRCAESMSLPVFRYNDLVEQAWVESDLHALLSRPFLFFVFEEGASRQDTRFLKAVDYRFSERWMESAEAVWEETVSKVEASDFGSFRLESGTDFIFVRFHGRNSSDLQPAPDGSMQMKRSFWISKRFLEQHVVTLV